MKNSIKLAAFGALGVLLLSVPVCAQDAPDKERPDGPPPQQQQKQPQRDEGDFRPQPPGPPQWQERAERGPGPQRQQLRQREFQRGPMPGSEDERPGAGLRQRRQQGGEFQGPPARPPFMQDREEQGPMPRRQNLQPENLRQPLMPRPQEPPPQGRGLHRPEFRGQPFQGEDSPQPPFGPPAWGGRGFQGPPPPARIGREGDFQPRQFRGPRFGSGGFERPQARPPRGELGRPCPCCHGTGVCQAEPQSPPLPPPGVRERQRQPDKPRQPEPERPDRRPQGE